MSTDPNVDLFGNPNTSPEPAAIADGKRRKTVAKGYVAPPGTGPAGETCRTCIHITRKKMAGTFLKCLLARERWTSGAGTDIKASAPACRYWNGGIGTAYARYEGKSVGEVRPQKVLITSRTQEAIETTFGTFKPTADGRRWRWTWGECFLERIVMKEAKP